MSTPSRRSPAWWVPSLYTAEGIPYVLVTSVATIMYGNLGLGNEVNALVHVAAGPALDHQAAVGAAAGDVGHPPALGAGDPVPAGGSLRRGRPGADRCRTICRITLALFAVAAFLSSTHDIGADGVYISVTTQKEQARYVGAQGIFWNAGRILATGPLVVLTASPAPAYRQLRQFLGHRAGAGRRHHGRAGPVARAHAPGGSPLGRCPPSVKQAAGTFADTLRTFFAKPNIWRMIVFVVLYRSGEGFLEKIGPLFMMAARDKGGLGLDNAAIGHIAGTFGTIGFMVGALVGGFYAARYGLRKTLLILCLTLNLPSAAYIYLAYFQPTGLGEISFWISLERVGWGFGSVGQMLYMMQQLSPGRYRTSHFAFGTALMAVGVMVPGAISGYIQVAMGYAPFFVFVMVASIPSVVATLFAPFPVKEEKEDNGSSGRPGLAIQRADRQQVPGGVRDPLLGPAPGLIAGQVRAQELDVVLVVPAAGDAVADPAGDVAPLR